jgi:PAS domain S-box-containing protein
MSDNILTSSQLASDDIDASLGTARAELARLQRELDIARRRTNLTLEVAGAAGSWDWDIVDKRLTADARFAALMGQDPVALADGVPTSKFFQSVHPEDLKRVQIAVGGILAGAELFDRDFRVVREDGGVRWVHGTGQAVFDEEERPIRFNGVLVDVTDQKRSQERLRVAQTSGGIGTFEHTDGYGTATVSEQFCALLGLHRSRVLPVRTINLLVHPEDRPIIDPKLPTAPRPETNIEFRIARADNGEQRWLARRGEYVPDVDSAGLRYIGVIYDITASKETEKRLQEANLALVERVAERTRERDRVWQNSRDILLVIGQDGLVRDANPALEEILGIRPSEVVGRRIEDHFWPEDSDGHSDFKIEDSDSLTNIETRLRHHDGSPRWVSWMTAHEDDLIYAFGRNVTAEREQAEALKHIEDQLRQSQKMEAVGQLTGGIAHDFNNMLTGVIGSLDILKRRIASGRLNDVDRFMEAATTSAQRAASLTHRLLAFSRRQSLDRRLLDVNQLVNSMQDLLFRTIGEQIALFFDLDQSTPYAVTDANQLESAILNLVINARDAMPHGGKLTIATSSINVTTDTVRLRDELKPGRYTVISVEDTGVGMPKSVIEKAFDPFFTTKPIGQGTGLGLSMIYGFTQQSGGSVIIESTVGKGSAIRLYLPDNAPDATPAEPERGTPAETPRGQGESVLVVEDDVAVRLLVMEVLADIGYVAIEAHDANSAISILKSDSNVDLLITDVGLPGLNGRQLAEIALEQRPQIRILFMTGYAANATSRGDFLDPGMDMILKPFAIDDLAQKIRTMILGGQSEK